MLEFRILGPLEVVSDGHPVRVGPRKQRATLAILLLSANRLVSVDRLADHLYAGAAPITAVTQVQRQISELRRALGDPDVIETRSPGYVLHVRPEQLDLARFERTAEAAGLALSRGEPQRAAELLRVALSAWRGPALADLADEPFARTAVERLEEIRLAALEQRADAELALGHHAELVAELEELAAEHPLRERISGQLMLALYRSGRQAEALEVYRRTRDALVEEFGIEPTPALRELERAILTQDRALALTPPVSSQRPPRDAPSAVLVVPSEDGRLDELLAVAQSLAARPDRELIVTRLLREEAELARTASALNARCDALPVAARTAAFTTKDAPSDIVRLATTHDVALVLLDAPAELDADRLPEDLASLLARSPADVAWLAPSAPQAKQGAGIFVPFGGGEHDWAALELAAWLSSAGRGPLHLVGTRSDPRRGDRDASRLLADAALAVQRVTGVRAEPLLAEADERALAAAVEPAGLVVYGISPRWRRRGIGSARRAVLRHARSPLLLVHRGPRPGGIAPRGSATRFSWSIEARAA